MLLHCSWFLKTLQENHSVTMLTQYSSTATSGTLLNPRHENKKSKQRVLMALMRRRYYTNKVFCCKGHIFISHQISFFMQSLHYFRCIESCGTGIKTRAIHFCQLRLLQKPRFLISGVLGRHRQIPRFVKKVQAADCSRMTQWLIYFAPFRVGA